MSLKILYGFLYENAASANQIMLPYSGSILSGFIQFFIGFYHFVF